MGSDESRKKQKPNSKATGVSFAQTQYDSDIESDIASDVGSNSSSDSKIEEFDFVAKDPTMQNITKGDFVLVSYATKKTKKYFVGVVLDKDIGDDTVEVKYLTRLPKKDSLRFVYPEKRTILIMYHLMT